MTVNAGKDALLKAKEQAAEIQRMEEIAMEAKAEAEKKKRSARLAKAERERKKKSAARLNAEVIPTSGTLSDIAKAHARRVARADAIRALIMGTEDETVASLEETLATTQAQLAAAQEHRTTVLAEQDVLVANFRAEAAEAEAAPESFRARVAANGLDELDVQETFELLHQLNTPIPFTILEKEEVSGVVLIGLTEDEMLSVLSIKTLGERRRLTGAVRRLGNRQGFGAPTTLPWDVEQVCAWLAEEELAMLQEGFRSQSIDGEVLLTLTRDDLDCLGVSTLGSKTTVMKKIEQAKKQYYAGKVVGGGGGGGGGGSSAPLSAEQQRLMLEHMLQENDKLAAKLKIKDHKFKIAELRGHLDARGLNSGGTMKELRARLLNAIAAPSTSGAQKRGAAGYFFLPHHDYGDGGSRLCNGRAHLRTCGD